MKEQNKQVKEEKAYKGAKEGTDMPGVTTTRLPYTSIYLTIRKARNLEWLCDENSMILAAPYIPQKLWCCLN